MMRNYCLGEEAEFQALVDSKLLLDIIDEGRSNSKHRIFKEVSPMQYKKR